jgi:hypothetical protein
MVTFAEVHDVLTIAVDTFVPDVMGDAAVIATHKTPSDEPPA